ncbi:MAG: hypothetical protein V1779_06315 [bacterium]
MDNTGFAELLVKLYQLESRTSTIFNFVEEEDNKLLTESISNSAIPGLIGKKAKVKANKFFFDGKNQSVFYIQASANLGKIQVFISDKAGNIVYEFPKDKLSVENSEIRLIVPSINKNENDLKAGVYFINAISWDYSGKEIKLSTYIIDEIRKMIFTEEGCYFVMNKIQIPYEDIFEIYGG